MNENTLFFYYKSVQYLTFLCSWCFDVFGGGVSHLIYSFGSACLCSTIGRAMCRESHGLCTVI